MWGLAQQPLQVDWHYQPSTELGGDAFGYHWIDDEHFALYLLDVCGHGVGAAMHGVAVLGSLRQQTLPDTDYGATVVVYDIEPRTALAWVIATSDEWIIRRWRS